MEDPETQGRQPDQQTPLLRSDEQQLSRLRAGKDFIGAHILSVHGEQSWLWRSRRLVQNFLTSKWGHYLVIALVSLDVSGIFADFLISLHICEHSGEKGFNQRAWEKADDALDVVSLVFSCLFMAELILCIWAFGFRYFNSRFHVFDATVIVAGFFVDVLSHGVIEEAGSLIVVGRLWRVFKIIEEFSSGAEDQMDQMKEQLEDLQGKHESLQKENEQLKAKLQINESE